MSKKYDKCRGLEIGGRKPTLSSLVILILILLQFAGGIGNNKFNLGGVDNGILFIIALFYLSCCSTCKAEF